jgi:AraC-like DNA-binding protein
MILDGDTFRRLCRARDFVAASYVEPVTVAEAARQAGISRYHFLRLFRRAFGETPHAFRTRLRLEEAKRRLGRGAPVTEVCFEVGYESLGSFSTLFAQRFGRSPSSWQREVRRLVQVPDALPRLYIPQCFFAFYTGG